MIINPYNVQKKTEIECNRGFDCSEQRFQNVHRFKKQGGQDGPGSHTWVRAYKT